MEEGDDEYEIDGIRISTEVETLSLKRSLFRLFKSSSQTRWSF